MQPLTIGNSGETWSVLLGVMDSYALKEVRGITKFTIVLAVIAIIAAAIIVFIVLNSVIHHIVMVADQLKEIAEGEGDLTHAIPIHSDDEVGDLAKYFNETLEKIKNLVVNVKGEADDIIRHRKRSCQRHERNRGRGERD